MTTITIICGYDKYGCGRECPGEEIDEDDESATIVERAKAFADRLRSESGCQYRQTEEVNKLGYDLEMIRVGVCKILHRNRRGNEAVIPWAHLIHSRQRNETQG